VALTAFTESLAAGDQLSVKFLTRVGTNPDGSKCSGPGGSHDNATGLRLYYDAATRPSRLAPNSGPSAPPSYFLDANGTTPVLNTTAPTGTTAKIEDSDGVKFTGGNPWKEIGSWGLTLP
jgi:hypothetical protein